MPNQVKLKNKAKWIKQYLSTWPLNSCVSWAQQEQQF